MKKRIYIKIKTEAEKRLAQQREHLVVSMLWLKILQLVKRGALDLDEWSAPETPEEEITTEAWGRQRVQGAHC